MDALSVPLPQIIAGKGYKIDSVKCDLTAADALKGYGIFPGADVKLLFVNSSGKLRAYEIMGAVIALRNEDADVIYASPSSLPI